MVNVYETEFSIFPVCTTNKDVGLLRRDGTLSLWEARGTPRASRK